MGPARHVSNVVNTSQPPARCAYGSLCSHCKRSLISDPAHIACAETICNGLVICIDCFRVGAADEKPHIPSHPYRVIEHVSTPIYDVGWSIHDEMRLLESICSYGPHHWREIANCVGKTPRQCEQHYQKVYVTSPSAPLPTLLSNNETDALASGRGLPSDHVTPPDSGNASDDDDLDQAFVPDPGSGAQTMLDGYMPNRGDLDVEYDDNAEELLSGLSITDGDSPEEKELKIRLLQLYDKRLQRRESMKQILFDRNFLDFNSLKFGHRKSPRDEKELSARLQIFSRILSKKDFDAFYSAVMRNYRGSRELYRLMQYRALGVKRIAEIDVYEAERKIREAALLDLQKKKGEINSSQPSRKPKKSPYKRRRTSAASSEVLVSPNPAAPCIMPSNLTSGLDGTVRSTGPRTLSDQQLPAPSNPCTQHDDSSSSLARAKVYVPLHQRIGSAPIFQTPQTTLRDDEGGASSEIPVHTAHDRRETKDYGTHENNISGGPSKLDEGETSNILASEAHVVNVPINPGKVESPVLRFIDGGTQSVAQPNSSVVDTVPAVPNASAVDTVPAVPSLSPKLVVHASNDKGYPIDTNNSIMTRSTPSPLPSGSVSTEVVDRGQACPPDGGTRATRLTRLKKIVSRSLYPEVEAMSVANLPDVWKLTRLEQRVCSMLHMSPSEFLQKRDAMLFLASQNAAQGPNAPEGSENDDETIFTLRSEFDSTISCRPTPPVHSDAPCEHNNLGFVSSFELPSSLGADISSRICDRVDAPTPVVVNDTDSSSTVKMKSVFDVGMMTCNIVWPQPSMNSTCLQSELPKTNSVAVTPIIPGPSTHSPLSHEFSVANGVPGMENTVSPASPKTRLVNSSTHRKNVLLSPHPDIPSEPKNEIVSDQVEIRDLRNVYIHFSSSDDVISNAVLRRSSSIKPPYRHEMGTQVEDVMEMGCTGPGYDGSTFYSLFTLLHYNEPLTVACPRDGNEHLELSVSSRSLAMSDGGDQREPSCSGMESDERDLYGMGKMIVEVDTKAIGIPVLPEGPISFHLREAVRNGSDDRSHGPSVSNEFVLDCSSDTPRRKDPSDSAFVQLAVTCKQKRRYRSFRVTPEQSSALREREAIIRGLTEVSFRKATHYSPASQNVDGTQRFAVFVKNLYVEPPEPTESEVEPEAKLQTVTNKPESVELVKTQSFIDSKCETQEKICAAADIGKEVELESRNADGAEHTRDNRMDFTSNVRRTKRVLESDDDDGSVVLVAITKRNCEIANGNARESKALPHGMHTDMNIDNGNIIMDNTPNRSSGYNTRKSYLRNNPGNRRSVTCPVPKKPTRKRGRPSTNRPSGDDDDEPLILKLRRKPPISPQSAAGIQNGDGDVCHELSWKEGRFSGIPPAKSMGHNASASSGFANDRNASVMCNDSAENINEEVIDEGRGDQVLSKQPSTGTLSSAGYGSIFNLADRTIFNAAVNNGAFQPADDSDSILILPNSNLSKDRSKISYSVNEAMSAIEVKHTPHENEEVNENGAEFRVPNGEKRYSSRRHKRKTSGNLADDVLRVPKRSKRCTMKARTQEDSDDETGQDDALLIRPVNDHNMHNPEESHLELYVPDPNGKTGVSNASRERYPRFRCSQIVEPYQMRKR